MICISAVQMELAELIAAVDRDILRPVAQLNFGRMPEYEIRPRSLLEIFTRLLHGKDAEEEEHRTSNIEH